MQIINVTGSMTLDKDQKYSETITAILAFLERQYNTYKQHSEDIADVENLLKNGVRNMEDTTTIAEQDRIRNAIWHFDSVLKDDNHIEMDVTRSGIEINTNEPAIHLDAVLCETAYYNPSAHDYQNDGSLVTVAEFKDMLYAEAAGHNGETNRSALALLLTIEDAEEQINLKTVLDRLKKNGYTGPETAFFIEAPDKAILEPCGRCFSESDEIYARLVLARNTDAAIADFLEFAPYNVAYNLEKGGVKWSGSSDDAAEGYPVNLVLLASSEEELESVIVSKEHLVTGYGLPTELEDLAFGFLETSQFTPATVKQRKPRVSA